ncbi:amino acid ABC transporter permease [Oscillospiraceae bacterium MB08-C2-2]|nr:amino acid ABC transporter permease [Oscillospiraceae bacterium MB08-C2-2]
MVFPFKPSVVFESMLAVLPYLPFTLLIVLLAIVLGLLLGGILARMKLSSNRGLRLLADGYTSIMRCTPSIVLLFIVFYGVPKLVWVLFRTDINYLHRGFFTVITFLLLYAATSSELMRSAYESVDKGQREAAVSIGLSEFQSFWRILLPQCFAVALPAFATSAVGLLKETALAFTIGLVDIMGKAKLVISNNYNAYAIETYLGLALIYWAISLLAQLGVSLLEKRLMRGKRQLQAGRGAKNV